MEQFPHPEKARQIVQLRREKQKRLEESRDDSNADLRAALHDLAGMWRETAMLHRKWGGNEMAAADYCDCAADLERILNGDYSPIKKNK